MDFKARAAKLKEDVPALFLALARRETPPVAKWVAGLTVAYALSPIDLIPDFIPVLGYLDDLLILPGLVALTIRLIPENILADCREKARGMWANGRPKRWYFAIPIALIWLAACALVIRAIWF